MMGPHHAVSGAAAWLALTTSLQVNISPLTEALSLGPMKFTMGVPLLEVSSMGVITGAIVTAGAALVPDADHHNATIAHSLPPVSNVMCAGLGRISGGHRHGTHSLLGIAFFTAVAWAAGLWQLKVPHFGTVSIGPGILSVLLIAFAAKALNIIPDRMRRTPWLLGISFGLIISFYAPQEQGWLPVAVLLGTTMHVLGDFLTVGGVNPIWPLVLHAPKGLAKVPVLSAIWRRSGYFSLPVLGKAGSWREWLVFIPISAYTLIMLGLALWGVTATSLGPAIAGLGAGLGEGLGTGFGVGH